ncbi:MAG: type 3 dihydrofolate reductase [Gammaproteobacteria bacterium]|jgi:dihydrofolate reductase|nr:type 3 dihydrofolate reductase [Gammaproteobacteria bacterium]
MIISLIAAMDRNRLIGNNNQLPWHLPADFAHFKAVTMGKPIVMGRKTFESIGKPLPGRTNIVLSRNPESCFEGAVCVSNFDEAMAVVPDAEEIMIIGGSTIYEMLMPRADRMYITYVDAEFDGDAWFPAIDKSQWREKESLIRAADDKNLYNCRFVTLERKQ